MRKTHDKLACLQDCRMLLLAAVLALGVRSSADAACNLIPIVGQAFPSSVGSVASPMTMANSQVELTLTQACDGSQASFDPSDVVTIRFLAAGAGQPPTVSVSPDVTACSGGQCMLRFTMPDTSVLAGAPTYGYAGPAEVVVTQAATEVAHIGPIFEQREIGSSCDKQPDAIFSQFTVLPPANRFKDIVGHLIAHTPTQALAALDAAGNLLVPVDWLDALPIGPGNPVARLVNGTLNVDAFVGTPGRIHVDPGDIRSFTVDGKPLPPLIRVSSDGDSVFGTADAPLSVIRVARVNAQGQPSFDLSYLPEVSSRGPVVFTYAPNALPPQSDFAFGSQTSVPLVDLKASPTGAAFAASESVEGDCPNGNCDGDQADQIAAFTDAATGTTTNTHLAASFLKNPIVGTAAVATGGNLAAFIQAEASENQGGQANGTDLNGNGQTTDDILRAYTLQDVEKTPDASRLASLFPAINRNPVAVDGNLVYYRVPDVRLGFQGDAVSGQHVAVTADGRYFFSGGGGTLTFQRRDGASGLPRGSIGMSDVMSPASAVVVTANRVYAAVPGQNAVVAAEGVYTDADVAPRFLLQANNLDSNLGSSTLYELHDGDNPVYGVTVIGQPPHVVGHIVVPGLQGVTKLAVTPPTSDSGQPYPRLSLYALAPAEHSLVAFDVTWNSVDESSSPAYHVPLTYVQTLLDDPSGTRSGIVCPPYTMPSATLTCIGPMNDARNLAVSPDGQNVYVAVYGGIIKSFIRNANSATLVEMADVFVVNPFDLAVSPDGAQLYVLAATQDPAGIPGAWSCPPSTPCYTLYTFNRNPGNGALGLGGIRANWIRPDAGSKLVLSPDGKALYVPNSEQMTTFARDTSTGGLTFRGHLLASSVFPIDAVVSPDSEHLYTQDALRNQGYRFTRTSALHAFDAATQADVPSVNEGTNLAAVADGRAAWMEQAYPASNAYVRLYDSRDDTAVSLISAFDYADPSAIALSSKVVAFVGKVSHPGLVVVSTTPPYAEHPLGLAAVDLGATDVCEGGPRDGDTCTTDADCSLGFQCGAVVAFTTPGGGGGNVLELYRDLDASTEVVAFDGNVVQNVVDFQVADNIIAFRVAENGTDLNGDGDGSDIVMFAYHLKSRRTFATAMPAKQCQVAGCEPGLPYKIRDGAIYFTTGECDQSCTVGPSSPDCMTQQPDCPGGGTDLNHDGHLGTVLQIYGDADGDGIFDREDDCVSTPNTDQLDTDHDGLGDACDPSPQCSPVVPNAPTAAPTGAAACQKAIGGASRTLIKIQLAAERKCLDQIAGGKLGGDPNTVCRGVPPSLPPSDPATAAKIAKAVTKFQTIVGSKCPDAVLGQLAACGSTASALTGCVSAAVDDAAFTVLNLLYGDVGSIGDPAALSCQKAIGKAAATEIVNVAKAMDGCLDAVNAGASTGNSQVTCLGAWAVGGPVAATDAKTAAAVDKAAMKAAGTIRLKCAPAALAPLRTCGGGSAAGVADCLRCAAFSKVAGVAGLVDSTY